MKHVAVLSLLAVLACQPPAAAQADSCPAPNWIFDIVETPPAPAQPLKRGLAVPVDKLGNFILNEHALEFDAAHSSLARFALVRQSNPQQVIPLTPLNSVKAGPLDFVIVHIPAAIGKVHFAPDFRVVDSFEKLRVVSSNSKRLVVAASKREAVVPGSSATARSLACPTTIEIVNIPSYIRGDSGSPIIDDSCNLVGITSKFAAGKDLFRNANNFVRIMQEVAKRPPMNDPPTDVGIDEQMLVLGRYEQFSALLERTGDVSIVSGYCMLASHIETGLTTDLYQPQGGYSREMFARRDRDFDVTLSDMKKLTDIVPFVSDAVRAVKNGSRPEQMFAIGSLLKLAHIRGISSDAVDDFIAGPDAVSQSSVTPVAAPGATRGSGSNQSAGAPAQGLPTTAGGSSATVPVPPPRPAPGAPAGSAMTGSADSSSGVAVPTGTGGGLSQGPPTTNAGSIGKISTVSDAVLAAEGQISKVSADIPRLLLRLSPAERVLIAAEMAEMAQSVLTRAETFDQIGAARRLADGSVAISAQVAGLQQFAGSGQTVSAVAYATIAKGLSSYSQASALAATEGLTTAGGSIPATAREQAKSKIMADAKLNVAVAEVSAKALRLDWENPQAWTSFAQSSINLGDQIGALKAASLSARSCHFGALCPAAAIADAARAKGVMLPNGTTSPLASATAAFSWQVDVPSLGELGKAPVISLEQQKTIETLIKDGAFGPNAVGVWSKAAACPSCLPTPKQLTNIEAVIGRRGTQF